LDVVRLAAKDLSLAAAASRLHTSEIHHGLLPLLGDRFLTRLYLAITEAPRAGVWAVVEGGRLVGFIAGCADVGAMYKWLLLHRIPRLALAAGLSLMRASVLKKIPSVLLYPFTRKKTEATPGPAAELLAIAVGRDQQGKGTGKRLLAAFEDALRGWGVAEYRVQTNVVEEQSNAFYRRAGFAPTGTRAHHALVLQIYSKTLGA
jgi:GNAT superfamily N-acetyltransferase